MLWFETTKTTIPCFIKHSYNYFSTGVFSLASRHLPRIKKAGFTIIVKRNSATKRGVT
jgi:hypothetical protein